MFRRDDLATLPTSANLLQPKLLYIGDKSSLLSMEVLREAYMLAAINLKRARDKQHIKKTKDTPKFKVRDQETNLEYKMYAQLQYL